MRRLTWKAKIGVFLVSLVLGGGLALLSNEVMADTNTISSTVTGTTTVDKTPPTASAPSIVVNNQDVCTSASSVAVQTQILGFATGQTVTDENCERLKLARSLYGMGMKVAAVSVLCQDQRVWTGMMMAGTPCPYLGSIGEEAKRKWENNNYQPPTFEPKPVQKIVEETLPPVEGKEEGNADFAIGIGAIAALLLLL